MLNCNNCHKNLNWKPTKYNPDKDIIICPNCWDKKYESYEVEKDWEGLVIRDYKG